MSSDGEIDYSDFTLEELIEARGSIDEKRYPKNLANLEAALEKLGGMPAEPAFEEIAERHEAVKSTAKNAYYIFVSVLAMFAALYLGVTGFIDEQLVLERKSRGINWVFDGLSAQIASIAMIVFALNLAFTVYMFAMQKTFAGISKIVANLGWLATVGLIIVAFLVQG